MSTTQDGGHITKAAGADLSAKQYFVVKLSSNTVVLSSAGSDNHLGVLQNNPVSGDTADVLGRHAGNTGKVIAGGSISAGNALTSDADGKAVATTTEDDHVFGYALSAADAGDIFEYRPSDNVVPPAS